MTWPHTPAGKLEKSSLGTYSNRIKSRPTCNTSPGIVTDLHTPLAPGVLRPSARVGCRSQLNLDEGTDREGHVKASAIPPLN